MTKQILAVPWLWAQRQFELMITTTSEVVPGTLTLALESLDVARRDLDAAVLALPTARGDDFMANPSLVRLLFRVVMARRHVQRIELASTVS